mmetsp:Transcript_51479/g.112858  ORF Transcript_51479/g.112858 Transcript_51479/m.112858 type:complete len:363 (+) Transcript_51479:193-1281(+)
MEELLAAIGFTRWLIPRLAIRIRGVGTTLRVLLLLQRHLVMCLHNILQFLHRDSHLFCQISSCVELPHDSPAFIVLAMPVNLFGSHTVQNKTEWRLVLPHFSSYIIAAAQLICETIPFRIQQKTSNTAKCFSGQKFHLGILIANLDKPRGMYLYPFQVNCGTPDSLAHLDTITSAMLTVRSGQVHEVRSVLAQERIGGEIRAKSASGQDDWSEDLDLGTLALVFHTNDCAVVGNQVGGAGLSDDLSHVSTGVLLNLLNHLDQSIGDSHSRKTLFASVGPGCRVPAKSGNQGQVKRKGVHQPIHGRARFMNKYLGNLGLLGTTLQCVAQKEFVGIVDALGFLSLSRATIDATRCLGGIAATER